MTAETVLTNTQAREFKYHNYPNDLRMVRAIEQAVLQSPEVQRLRKDAGRYRWLRDRNGAVGSIVEIFINDEAWGSGHLDSQVDAAMEKQP